MAIARAYLRNDLHTGLRQWPIRDTASKMFARAINRIFFAVFGLPE